jgi:hypothetical protein
MKYNYDLYEKFMKENEKILTEMDNTHIDNIYELKGIVEEFMVANEKSIHKKDAMKKLDSLISYWILELSKVNIYELQYYKLWLYCIRDKEIFDDIQYPVLHRASSSKAVSFITSENDQTKIKK